MIFAIVILLVATLIKSKLEADKRFTIEMPFEMQELRTHWSAYPTSINVEKSRGIQLTKPKEYPISGLTFNNAIEMVNSWEMDITVFFEDGKPTRGVEREGEEFEGHADTVALHFSSHLIPAENIGESADAIPVEGGVFFLLKGKQKLYFLFKNIPRYSGLTQRYIDIIYQNAKYHTSNLKHFSCEIRSKDVKSFLMSIRTNLKKKTIKAYYKTNDRDDWKLCFKMNHIDRYLDLNFHFFSLFSMTPKERNSKIWLYEAFLDHSKVKMEKVVEYSADFFSDINDRVGRMRDSEKFLPKKDVYSLIKLESMINKRSQLIEKFAIDFHKGLQTVQEHLLHGAKQTQGKDAMNLGVIKKIRQKIENLEKRQAKIYKKFVKLHESIDRKGSLEGLQKRFNQMERQIESIANNIDEKALKSIVEKSKKVIQVFKSISDQETAWNSLDNIKRLQRPEAYNSTFYYIIMAVGVITVGALVMTIIKMISKSQRNHYL